MGRFAPWVDMELSLFAPPDLTALYRLQASRFDPLSEHEAVDIVHGKEYETKVAMESLHHYNVQTKMLKRITTAKLRRLDEYKHAFIQFLTKRLSLSRSSPRISSHKMEHKSKDSNVITNSLHKKIEFNIPIIHHDAIKYEKKSDSYPISTYSKMSRCVWLGTKVTVRKMLSDAAKDGSTLKAEVHVLGQIRHPCILLLLATTYDDKNNLMLLYENVEHGSLYVYLHEELRSPTEDFILSVLDQMAQVFIFLHQSKWIHTNLTSHAIQMMSFHRVKLSCFELATHPYYKTESNPQSNKIRAHLYNWQAPEYYAGGSLGEHTDIFQFGLLTWEICQRKIPWSGLSGRELKEKYQMNEQAIALIGGKALPQLISIMDQSLNINPEERRLNFDAALKLISSAKSSSTGVQMRKLNVPANQPNQETNQKCHPQPMAERSTVSIPNTDKTDSIATSRSSVKSQSSSTVLPIKVEKRFHARGFSENIQDTTDSFTGLRRVSESNFKTFYAWSTKENEGYRSFSGSKKSKSCHSKEKFINGESDIADSTQCQQYTPSRCTSYRSISASACLNSVTSSMTAFHIKAGATTSSRIKPASHSLEKQLSSSSSQEFSWSGGSSTPYRASAIKPASHQSERGFSRCENKRAFEDSKSTIMNNSNSNNGVSNFKYITKENQSYTTRNEGKSLCREYQHMPKDAKPLLDYNYPSLLAKETGEISGEININPDDNNTRLQKYQCLSSNHEKSIMPNLLGDGGPEVITKLCEQLLIMINEPRMIKKENESLNIESRGVEKSVLKTKQERGKDFCLKNPIFTDACIKKLEKPLLLPKRPSTKLLKILGLNLIEFYQDDELGPSLWNDENMQLGMYQDFENSFETFVNIDEYSPDQHNDIILWSEDIDFESDPEVKSKCQFNALYYTLNQRMDEEGNIRKEE